MPPRISLRRINLVAQCVLLSAKYQTVSEKSPHETARLERLEGFALVAIFAGGPKNDRLVSAAGETARNNEPTNDIRAPGVCSRFVNCVSFQGGAQG